MGRHEFVDIQNKTGNNIPTHYTRAPLGIVV